MNGFGWLDMVAGTWRTWCRRAVNAIRDRIIVDYHAVNLARAQHAVNLARAQQAVEALVRDGWQVGPVPYGYRAVRVGVATASGRRRIRVRLAVEPVTGPVVELTFYWRVHEHLGYAAIVRRLADVAWCPPPSSRRSAMPGVWSVSAVRAILANPVYTGRTVWGRTRHGHPLPPTEWILSELGAHSALADDISFARAGVAVLPTTQHRRSAA